MLGLNLVNVNKMRHIIEPLLQQCWSRSGMPYWVTKPQLFENAFETEILEGLQWEFSRNGAFTIMLRYRKTSSINRTKTQNPKLKCFLYPVAIDRRCSNYIWVINNFLLPTKVRLILEVFR